MRRTLAAAPQAAKAPKSAGSTPKVAKVTVVKSTPATMESEIAAVRKMKATRKPVAPAIDALAICNGCGAAPALPDSAAGYCAACEAAAKGSAVAALVLHEE